MVLLILKEVRRVLFVFYYRLMTHRQFEELKNTFKNRSAGAFIDAFYYFKDSANPSSPNFHETLHRPTITVICAFQRVPEGSSWTRPMTQGTYTPTQNLHAIRENRGAPRVPIEQLLPVEHNLGWTPAQYASFLTTIMDIPLEFLIFVIYHKLMPAVEFNNSNWATVILQPLFWRSQWLFYEVANGNLAANPRVASRTYPYYRRGGDFGDDLPDYTQEENRDNWRHWYRPPNMDRHLQTLLRALLLSDPEIVSSGYNNEGAHWLVDLDLLNSPLSWNTIGLSAGSDLEFPGATALRNIDSVQFENGITVCQSQWFISPNFQRLSRNRHDSYWNRQHSLHLTPLQIARNWQFWREELQIEWNEIFLHESIFSRARARHSQDFAGVNINLPRLISSRNETAYSIMRSRFPLSIAPPSNPRRSRPPSMRLFGRGAPPASQEPSPQPPQTSFTLSDYIFFLMLQQ